MSRLRRDLRQSDLILLVVNLVIGAGIFGLPSRVYALSGPYSLLAYVVCAVLISLVLVCFAEVSSRFRETGGLYLYARETFGPFIGFEVGWLAWLVRITGLAALCNLFADYLAVFLPASGAGPFRAFVIVGVVALLTTMNLVGVRVAASLGNVFTIAKLAPLLILVVAGAFAIVPASYVPLTPLSYDAFSGSVLLLVFAFAGFENATIPAGESANPQRDLPRALLAGTGFAMVLYLAIQAVCIGVLPGLSTSTRPLADSGARLLGGPGAALISVGALISVMGTMSAVMLSAPRLLFAMAEQGQLPSIVAATHTRFQVPHVAIYASAAGMLGFSLTGTFASAALLSTVIRLVTYAVTCAALPVLRRTERIAPPLFVVPGGDAVSGVALALIVWLFSSTSWPDATAVVLAVASGAVMCWTFSPSASRRSA